MKSRGGNRGGGEFEALLEESFRTFRSNLLLKLQEGEKSLLFSSAKPQEGKTHNCGYSVASSNPKVSCFGVWKTTRRHSVNSRCGSRPKVLAGSIFCSCVGRKELLARVASVAR